ncbi:MAG: thiamine pyrophosphate-binding protein [Candidatus Tectomicrobia bacterium]
MVTYADVIAKLLADAGIEYIFGMPGSRASVELIEAARKQGLHYVLSNNESAAAVMAATYGILQGRPGVCSTGVGPGATNAINGIAHAQLERAPMLILTDCYPAPVYRHLSRQRIDQVALFEPVTKGCFPIAEDSAERSTRRALHLAMEGRPGPVHLDLPDDVLLQESPGLPEPYPYQRWDGGVSPSSPAVQHLADAITNASRPVVIAGLGINRSACEGQVKSFVEALHAPVLFTISTKGSLSDRHSLCGGTFMGSESSHDLVASSDLIITVGLDVVELFEPGLWPYHQQVLNIDTVPHLDELFHPAQELVADIGSSLDALTALVSACPGWSSDEITTFRQQQRPASVAGSRRLLPLSALQIMRQVLPEDTILTADAGQHKVYASRLWESYQPLGYLTSSGLGSMGVAIPIAITAKLVRPQHPVVALTGDGGFLMRVSELETASREHLPIIVVVFNDGYLNLIRMKQDRQAYAVLGSKFAPVDYLRVAEGFGFRAASADTDESFEAALRQAVESGEAWVIDAQIDPDGYQT